jgi:predicted dehydrogenase
MTHPLDRRQFLGAAASAGVALGLAPAARAASETITVGIMGTGTRGRQLAPTFLKQPNVTVAYVCDVDKNQAALAANIVGKAGKPPQVVQDFRRILDDKAVDVLVVATCNHWHAPAAILACAAGKHVYVEKPLSHNPREGELLVEAARKYNKQVQMGNQRRSTPKIQEAIQRVRDGAIGRAYLAQSWYVNNRPSIGRGKPAPVPEGLDYDLWQGPAPRRPYKTNYLHYNWHWFWHWGNGELGNNGIHMVDLCRWGLGVDYPVHVNSAGGRYHFEDDQETPDTHLVTFGFDDRKTITWEGLSCVRPPDGTAPAVVFVGEKGSLKISDSGYTIHDAKGKEVEKVTGAGRDEMHVGSFLDGVRENKPLNSPVPEAHKSTLLCHLGNIAQRTGRSLRCDPKNGHIIGDKEAMAPWAREYEKGWEPKV